MEQQTFLNLDGTPNNDGRSLIEWIESHFIEADRMNDVAYLNSMSGDIQHYYVNVYKLNKMTGGGSSGMTAEQWLRDYRNSSAMNAWRNFQFKKDQAVRESQLEATTAKTAELEAGLNEFKESLAAQMAKLIEENAKLREDLDKLTPKSKRKQAVDADEDESEA